MGLSHPRPKVTHVTTANAAIKAAPGVLLAVVGSSEGAVTPTVTIYDDPDSATAPILVQWRNPSNSSFFLDFSPLGGLEAAAGLYIGASAWTTFTATVYWA